VSTLNSQEMVVYDIINVDLREPLTRIQTADSGFVTRSGHCVNGPSVSGEAGCVCGDMDLRVSNERAAD
jgi:hypothetical protein